MNVNNQTDQKETPPDTIQPQTVAPIQPIANPETQIPPIPENTLPQEPVKRTYIPILIVAAVIGLIISGFFAFQYFQLKNEKVTLVQTSLSPTLIPTSPTTKANLSRNEVLRDWKTYTNTKYYGYNFEYPQDLTLNGYQQPDSEEEIIEFTRGGEDLQTMLLVGNGSSDFNIAAYEDAKSKAGEKHTGTFPNDTTEGTASGVETSVAGITAYQVIIESDVSYLNNTFFERGGLYYQLSFISQNKDEKEMFTQILSTFEFTK